MDGEKKKSTRGFASMKDKDRHREIARKGGLAAQAKGDAHKFTPEEARIAGRKGGMSVARNREHMARIGAIGGSKRQANAVARFTTPEKAEDTP